MCVGGNWCPREMNWLISMRIRKRMHIILVAPLFRHHTSHCSWQMNEYSTRNSNSQQRANRTSGRPHKSSRNRSLHHFVSCCQRINNIPKRIVHCSVKFLSSANCSKENVFWPVGPTAFFFLHSGIFVCESFKFKVSRIEKKNINLTDSTH